MNDPFNNINNSPEVKLKIAASKLIENNHRKDCYGTIISKKSKKHKICFSDKLDNDKKIAEIHIVTSFKQFYEKSNNL